METVRVNTSQHVDIDYPVAGLGERVAAYLIDYGIFFAIYLICIFIVAFGSQTSGFNNTPFIIMVVVYLVSYVFYDLLCEIFMNGQSVGKKVLKIKVVSLDGGQPTFGQYLIRWVFRIVDFVLSFGLGGFISVAVSDKKQRIGDRVAGTTLIKTKAATTIDHIAFAPTLEDYQPTFEQLHTLSDADIELVHEVIRTYYKTYNPNLVYEMAAKLQNLLSITLPEGMNELDFLKTVVNDYTHVTARA